MKIALFGATGRVGGEVLKLALVEGHEVTVLVRSPEKLVPHDRLTISKVMSVMLSQFRMPLPGWTLCLVR